MTAPILPPLGVVTLVHPCATKLGEGPLWDSDRQRLYWVDIAAPAIWCWRWADGAARCWTPPMRVTALALREGGGFVAATDRGIALLDPEAGLYRIVCHPEPDRPQNRFNDGKADSHGRFWAGTMDDGESQASGALYRIDPDLGCTRLDDGYLVTNGPAIDPSGDWLYHADSPRGLIYRFRLHPDGALSDRTTFAHFDARDGFPDGMTVDTEGGLWVAFWDGACLRRLDPGGRVTATIAMPVQRPSSCTFGGPDLDLLFVTSAHVGLSDAGSPDAGGLFMIRTGARGLPAPLFAG